MLKTVATALIYSFGSHYVGPKKVHSKATVWVYFYSAWPCSRSAILTSELVISYMEDVILGGSESTVVDDITIISNIGPSYGLQLNT